MEPQAERPLFLGNEDVLGYGWSSWRFPKSFCLAFYSQDIEEIDTAILMMIENLKIRESNS